MVTYHNGDLLESGCNIICHQVNLEGVMGGGLALQIARKYPECEREYSTSAKKPYTILGRVHLYQVDDYHLIANCFTQDKEYNTDYPSVSKAFEFIHDFAHNYKMTVGIPFKYGCGIAKGNWETVEQIIKSIFDNSSVECQIWKYEA